MAKEFSKAFYNSTQWRRCRKSFVEQRISIDGGICQQCKSKLGYIVDHREELTLENISDYNLTLSFNNLRYLCLDCHNTKTSYDKNKKINKYIFDDEGNLIWLTPP